VGKGAGNLHHVIVLLNIGHQIGFLQGSKVYGFIPEKADGVMIGGVQVVGNNQPALADKIV
jgi:hypothetical protein